MAEAFAVHMATHPLVLRALVILVYFSGRGTLTLHKKEEAGFCSILDHAFSVNSQKDF